MIRLCLAQNALGNAGRLIIGVLHRFHAHDVALGKVTGKGRAIADGIDIGQRRAAEFIDIRAIGSRRARRDQGRDRGDYADADDHRFGRDDGAIAELNARNAAFAYQRLNRDAGAKVHAMGAVFGFVKGGKLGASNAGQDTWRRFQDGYRNAKLGQHGGGLKPDIAAADDAHTANAAVDLAHQLVAIGARAHRVDAGQIRARA